MKIVDKMLLRMTCVVCPEDDECCDCVIQKKIDMINGKRK